MPEIQVDWHSQQEADRLRDLRDRHGMVWRGVLLEGAKHAESVDLLKALTELHPALATTLPNPTGDGAAPSRSELTEELREQIREQQRIRATAEIPLSAFDDETNADTQRQREGNIESDPTPEVAGVEAQPSRVDTDRTRAYKQWDVQEARALEDGEVLHLDAHADVGDVLRHEGQEADHPDDELEEWEIYDDHLYDYSGDY
ncbi:hypothetical protein [Haloferax sp. ATB1]|uniref:hypothetical protein n=1 Tax=Haloferax sp. ATB1 TaxID=1508454 RepID=UPI0005B2218C|nr:hypothetical protein [Haloferax sp. ATB1]